MKTLVIALLTVLASTTVFASVPKGTAKEGRAAEIAVSKGIYITEFNRKVEKPTADICDMYRNTYAKYQQEYGNSKGALIWLVIVTRRGC